MLRIRAFPIPRDPCGTGILSRRDPVRIRIGEIRLKPRFLAQKFESLRY